MLCLSGFGLYSRWVPLHKQILSFKSQLQKSWTAWIRKYTIKAEDSVVGANSAELRDKIMQQIANDPRKTKQVISNLKLAEGERQEFAMNLRIQDGMTNGTGNIVKKISQKSHLE